jgi:hypothetical protein
MGAAVMDAIERYSGWLLLLVVLVALYLPDLDRGRYERRIEALDLPPCHDCTRGGPRVYTAGTPYTLTTHVARCVEHPDYGCID